MQTIHVETRIAAPVERCFLLSLSMDLHVESTAQTDERAVAGVMHGTIGAGESVTWEGRHFGLRLRHTSLISKYERPFSFQDVMTEGMFKSFEHDHHFAEENGATLMLDVLRFAAPTWRAGDAGRGARAEEVSGGIFDRAQWVDKDGGGVGGVA